MQNKRIVELDALRGIAAVSVVLFHYLYRFNELYGHKDLPVNWIEFGQYGVQLFFIISGFVIYWTINNTKKPADFIVSRFSRLYPVYWASIIVTFFSVGYFGLEGRDVSTKEALINLIMFQDYFDVSHVDGVYWTLTVELTFYFWIFSLSLFNLLKKVEYLCIPVILLGILHYSGGYELPSWFIKALLIKHLPFFVVGICFYKIINGLHDKFSIPIILLCLFESGVIHGFSKIGLFASFFIVFYLAVSGRLPFLANKVLIYLGAISYPLYLIHQNIGYIIINKFYAYNYPALLGVLTAILFSILTATLLMKLIEQPLLSLIRSIYKKPKVQFYANKISNIR